MPRGAAHCFLLANRADADPPFRIQAIVGTLKAAKKRGIVSYEGEMLLKGMSDNVEIKLLKTEL